MRKKTGISNKPRFRLPLGKHKAISYRFGAWALKNLTECSLLYMSTVLSGLSVFVQIAVFSLSPSGNSNSLETIMLYKVASMLIDVNYSKFPKTDI